MNEKPNNKLTEAMAAVDREADVVRAFAPAKADPKLAIILTFRHSSKDGNTIIDLIVPDMLIGEVMLSYLQRAGTEAKLVQPTPHSDVRRILMEV
jgi:hypothetical protein